MELSLYQSSTTVARTLKNSWTVYNGYLYSEKKDNDSEVYIWPLRGGSFDSLGSLWGKVTDEKTGAPIKNAEIKLSYKSNKYETKTDEYGDYQITNIEYGKYKLEIKKKRYKTYKEKNLEINGDVFKDIQLKEK